MLVDEDNNKLKTDINEWQNTQIIKQLQKSYDLKYQEYLNVKQEQAG